MPTEIENSRSAADEAILATFDKALADFNPADFGIDEEDIEDVEVIEVIEEIEPVLETQSVLDAEPVEVTELDQLNVELTKSAVYEETVSTADTIDDLTAAPAPKAEKPKKERAPRAAKTVKAAPLERDLAALPPEAFVLNLGDPASDAHKDAMLAVRAGVHTKKVAEKFDQTIAALHAGRKPSTYVLDAFAALDKEKSRSYAELIQLFVDMDYGKGTATAQVGQIMQLFPLLAIADKEGTTLKLRAKSAFAEKLRTLSAA